MLNKICSGICAGIMVSIGGAIFLACENRVVGAVLFCTALLTVCVRGYSLYTGRIGFLTKNMNKEYVGAMLLGLLGNTIAVAAVGFLLRGCIPHIGPNAETLVAAKLGQTLGSAFVRACFCGVLMYCAVAIYKSGTPLGIFFCIPTFILAGFEHSVADMFYFAAGGEVSMQAFVYIWVVILGNTVGGLALPVLEDLGKADKA